MADQRLLRRGLVAAVVVEHLLLVIAPLDVLHPVDAWVVGRRLLHGHLPYRDFGFEYPPLAALAFVLPGLAPHGIAPSVLALQEVAAELVVVWVVLRRDPDALWRYLVLSLLLFPFLSGGFDALPMAAIALSTAWLASGEGRGWFAAGAGTLVKLSPGGAWLWARARPRLGVAVLLVTVALAVVPQLMARTSNDGYIGYALHRGVQVESVPATVTWVAHELAGTKNVFAYRFKSWQIAGAGAAADATAALAALAGVVVFAVSRRRRIDPWFASLVVVVLFVCGAKVLSPQYLAWAAPVAAVVGGGWYVAYASAAVLTMAAYALTSGATALLAVSAARNLVLVALAAVAMTRVSRRD